MTPRTLERGRRFGLGLQLTNVLKDHESDRGRGICYIPSEFLRDGLPGAPLSPEGMRALLERTLEHLAEAQAYILSIPATETDCRLFCLWAQHLALATLRVIADSEGPRPPKVSRAEVAAIVAVCRETVGRDDLLEARYRDLAGAVRRRISV